MPVRKTVRLRYAQTALIAIVLVTVMATPFAVALLPWGLAVYVVLGFAVYCLRRTGAEISATDVTVTGPFYSRRVPLDHLRGLVVGAKGGVYLLKDDGSELLIPTARARDLPQLRTLLFAAAAPADSI